MNYSELSDFEINKLVAESLGYVVESDDPVEGNSVLISVLDGGYIECPPFDPCNKPSHAWLIIVESKIDVIYFEHGTEDYWTCCKGNTYHRHANPLRAAMIVYLMMREENAN